MQQQSVKYLQLDVRNIFLLLLGSDVEEYKCLLLSVQATGQNSSVGIATRYGLGGSVFGPLCGRDNPNTSRMALRPTEPPLRWVPGIFTGEKALWGGRSPPPPLPTSAEVKQK